MFYLLLLFIWGTFLPGYFNKNMRYKLGYYGFMHTRLREVENYKNVDILILGSSHAYRGFDPRIFKKAGFSIFNLGSSNQTPIQSYLLLKKYLPILKPKLVILEVYPEGLEMDGVESAVDIISNTPSLLDAWNQAKAVDHLTAYNTFIYTYLRQLLTNDNSFKEQLQINKDTYINGGFVERAIEYNNDTNLMVKNQWKINPKQLSALNKSIQLMQTGKIPYPFILVQTPITHSLENTHTNQIEIDKIYSKLGTYYYRPCPQLINSLDFYDPHHLNQNGVIKFNLQFISDLKKLLKEGSIYMNL